MATNDSHAALAAALAARSEAAAKHTADAEALARGRERLAEAQGAIDKLAAEDADAVTRHAKRLESQTRAGKSGGPVPVLAPTDRHVAAQIAAQRTREAAAQMVASLERAESASRDELAGAERAVGVAADGILSAEAEVLASEIQNDLAAVQRKGERLALYVPDQLNTPIDRLRSAPARVRETLDRLAAAFRDDLNTPVWQLRGVPPPHSDFLAKRRAALIDGAAEGANGGVESERAHEH